MARIRAVRMSLSSISWAEMLATDQARAVAWIPGNRASRRFSVSFLESFRPGMSAPMGRITAAAYTGPARGPAPASSQPQMWTCPSPRAWRSYCQRSISSMVYLSLVLGYLKCKAS